MTEKIKVPLVVPDEETIKFLNKWFAMTPEEKEESLTDGRH